MSYNGFEVFALALGNADSFLIRHYEHGAKTNILIDGGNTSDGKVVLKFLAGLGETRLDHVVCSHHHADHAGGLVEIFKSPLGIGQLWIHVAEMVTDHEVWASGHIQSQKAFAEKMELSRDHQKLLVNLALQRHIPIHHPFSIDQQGTMPRIGPLSILSPTPEFYAKQIERMQSESLQDLLNSRYATRENRKFLLKALRDLQDEIDEQQGGLGNEPTAPDNEVSTVLGLVHGERESREVFLFTGDAGVEALSDVRKRFGNQLENLAWMQVPHHGSRRNLTEELVQYFHPKHALVSAKGSIKHPSRKLVNLFKAGDTRVLGTYWKDRKPSEGHWIRWRRGTVPEMETVPVPALWD